MRTTARILADLTFIAAGVFIGLQVFHNPLAAILMAVAVVIADLAINGRRRRGKRAQTVTPPQALEA